MEQKKGTYDSTYVFSADQQEEVKKIYRKYATPEQKKQTSSEEDGKMELLRKLDRSVTTPGIIAALLTGICGAAIHGIGMAWIQGGTMFAPGTVIAIVGLLLFLVSYPVYGIVVKKRRRKVEAQILTLCRELMK